MDTLSPSWFTELEMDDPIFMNSDGVMNSLNEEFVAILEDDFQLLPENGSPTFLPPLAVEEHQQNAKNPNFDQSIPTMDLCGNSNRPCVDGSQLSDGVARVRKRVKATSRTKSSQSHYDHIIAERKRREQLSQYFVALSAIVPGLKRMDKTSVLGDAIKHLKQLQEKVKVLEEKARKQTIESLVLVKHSQLIIEDDNESEDMEEGGGSAGNSLPEIDARICDKSVLIRIHCEKHKGVMIKIISHIEKMNLALISSSVSRFGTIGVYYTIITEMEQEFNATLNDIVTSLRSVVRRARQ